MKSPISFLLRACVLAVIAGSALSSCSVSSDGPAMAGALHGTLGSTNMCDYYYKKAAGWTYTFRCVENVYASDESTVAHTYVGPNETVYTMGYDGLAPNGDSLYRYQITYKITSDYYMNGTQPPFDVNYLASTRDNNSHGAFVLPGDSVQGMSVMSKRPRPVSTDTILAGVAGHIRTLTGNFDSSSSSSLVTCTDTLWVTSHLDSVFIWERQYSGGPLVKERCIFNNNFSNNYSWTYDVINNPNPTTTCVVADPNSSFTVPGTSNTYPHTVKIRIKTSEVDDKDFNREWKYYACGNGVIYQYDWWYTTEDGVHFTKKDFARSLISLSH